MSTRSDGIGGVMRNRRAGLVALASAILIGAALSPSAWAASATGHVSVIILPAAAVTEGAPLTFGGADLAGARAAGTISLTGTPHTAVTLSFSPGDGLARPGGAMSLGGFAHDGGASPSLNGAGTLTVAVGATLTIAPAQPSGRYQGTYAVVVNY